MINRIEMNTKIIACRNIKENCFRSTHAMLFSNDELHRLYLKQEIYYLLRWSRTKTANVFTALFYAKNHLLPVLSVLQLFLRSIGLLDSLYPKKKKNGEL